MKKIAVAAVVLLSALLSACGQPVPPEKADYVGVWQAESMYLSITQEGRITSMKVTDGVTTSVEGPLKGFVDEGFEAGVGPLSTTYVVSTAPYLDGDEWKMTVDDVELTKTSQ